MAIDAGLPIKASDFEYLPKGYYSVIAPGETHTFTLGLFSAFVFIGIGNGGEQFGIFYVTYEDAAAILGDSSIQVRIQPDTHKFTIYNNLSWYVDYTILGNVTRIT